MQKMTYRQKQELTAMQREIVMAPGVCLVCYTIGTKVVHGKLEMAHIIPKGHHLFTFDPRNALPLCNYHHQHSKVCSLHAGLAGFEKWLMMFCPEHYKFYVENKNRIGNISYEDAKALLVNYKAGVKS